MGAILPVQRAYGQLEVAFKFKKTTDAMEHPLFAGIFL